MMNSLGFDQFGIDHESATTKELINISLKFLSKADELIHIFKRESNNFNPPVVWGKSKWGELITGKL